MLHAGVQAAVATATPTIEARLLDEAGTDDAAWRAAAASARGAALFQTPAWARHALARDRAAGLRSVLLRIDEGGAGPALLPLSIGREQGVMVARLLGEPLAQYGDAIGAAVSPDGLRRGAEALRARFGVDLLLLRRVRDDAAIAPALDGLGALRCDPSGAPFLPLSPSGPAPLEGGGEAHALKDARRLRRRLERRHEVSFETLRSSPRAVEAMRRALAWKLDWLRERGLPSRLLKDPTLGEALLALAADPEVETRIGLLSLDGRPAAADVGFAHDGRFYGYLVAYDPEFRSRGVGKIAMADTAAAAAADGLHSYDHLPPADPYKFEWTDRSHPVADRLLPLTALGGLRARLFDAFLKPALKEAVLRRLRRAPAAREAAPAEGA